MKTKITLFGLSLFFSLQTFSQSPNWLWAKSAGGTSDDYARSVTADASGNIIATGYFSSPSITFGSTTLTNADNTGNTADIFIVKYDAAGNVLWAKSAGGTSNEYAYSVTTDALGNIIAAGIFNSSTITFGSTTLSGNMFIVKYDASGNVLWAQSSGGSWSDYLYSVTSDVSGNIIAAGYFASPSITFGSTTLTLVGGWDMFIVKYDAAGNVLWAKSAGGTTYDVAYSVTADASGNIIAAGYFDGSTLTFGSTTLFNTGNDDMFIVKYDAAGNVLWAKSAGGTNSSYEYARSVTADASGNIIAAGYFNSTTLTFGSTTLTNSNFPLDDIFIVKYSPAGNVLWAKSAGGSDEDYAYSVTADASGNIIAAGYSRSSNLTFGSTTLTNAGNFDMFIVKYDAAGNVLWAKSAGGTSDEYAYCVAADAPGNIIAAGYFDSSTLAFGSTTLTNAGIADMFVAKLDVTIGINEMTNDELQIKIYPNPATTEVILNLDKEKQHTVQLCNTLGEILFQATAFAEQMKIDMKDFPSGIYFVKILSGEKFAKRKIIKQ